MRFLAIAAADSSTLVAELDAVAAQDAAAVQAALGHAALQLRLSSTTTMSASTQPSMARLLRVRRPRRTPLPRRPYSPTLIAPYFEHPDRAVFCAASSKFATSLEAREGNDNSGM